MLARRLPGLLPPLSFDEALTVTTIHSVAGLVPPGRRSAAIAAVSRAASHVLGRGAGWRREHSAARRAQPGARRRAVPRRAARVQPARARDAAAAARAGRRAHRARGPIDVVPGGDHARRGDESVSVRLRNGSHPRVPLLAGRDRAVPAATVGSAPRSVRSDRRGAGRAVARTFVARCPPNPRATCGGG